MNWLLENLGEMTFVLSVSWLFAWMTDAPKYAVPIYVFLAILVYRKRNA